MLDTAIEAARAAGHIIMENYTRPLEVRVKGLRDLVTEADLASQEVIVRLITARFPSHAILAEEDLGSLSELGEYTWIVDPLDGTTNYAFRLPIFAVSIGLAHRGEPVMGVVYDPTRDHLFHAEVGQGAFLNGTQLRVAEREELIGTLVAFDSPRKPKLREVFLRLINHVAPRVGTFRAMGSAALGPCYVAAGWLDAYIHMRLSPWDAAAGTVILREAGGRATDFSGRPWSLESSRYLAASRAFHPQMVTLISQVLGPL
jgi:myo-inositol-1(or 4)-monophosphatase